MEIVDIAQWAALATVIVGIFAIIAHSDLQTRRLRAELHAGFNDLRTEMRTADNSLRAEMRAGYDALCAEMRDGFNRFDSRLHTIEQRTYELSNRLPAAD